MIEHIITEYDTPFGKVRVVSGTVVRCEDCKYQGEDLLGNKQCMASSGHGPLGNDDDYCSYAVRKDE